jgi:hypothetical protein
MWKFLRSFASEIWARRVSSKLAPGPLANLAHAYAGFDALTWPMVRCRLHPAEVYAR